MTLQERVHSFPPPASWQLGKLHRVFRVRKGVKNAGMQEDNLLSLSYGRIIQKDIATAEAFSPRASRHISDRRAWQHRHAIDRPPE